MSMARCRGRRTSWSTRSRRTSSDPAVQVVANPLVLLDRLPTREAARLVLEVVEKPQNVLTYQMGVWLATQKMVRGEFSPGERTELHMLVLRAWRRDPAQASEDLAELIAELPEGMRSTLVQAAVKAGPAASSATSCEHGEEVVATKAQRVLATSLADSAREGAPQEPTYAEDRMLTRLMREALFHRDTERRHCAALLVRRLAVRRLGRRRAARPARPGPATRRGCGPGWRRWCATCATTRHRLRMLPFVDDPDEQVGDPGDPGAGAPELQPELRPGGPGRRWRRSGRPASGPRSTRWG